MLDSTCIIEGTVKFRDGKKWKSRWCVVRKLSPVADCLHLQLYRDSKERYKQGQTKASLSLEQFVAIETGFTLDKESNTVALLCKDVVVVLAFDTRERLMQWQVKLAANLNAGPHFLVLLSSAPAKAKLPAGPARLHVHGQGFSLSSGVPPRLVGTWKLAHLRRYGVVDGRFCFEGGSRCGLGEGLHVLISDQAEEIVQVLQLASQGQLISGTRRKTLTRNMTMTGSPRATPSRLESRRGILDLPDHHIHLRSDSPFTDMESSYGCTGGTGGEINLTMSTWTDSASSMSGMGIDRCLSCMSKLGAMSRSSTAAAMGHCGGGWGIEHTCDRRSLSSGSDYSTWSQIPVGGKVLVGPGGTSSPKRAHSSSPSPLPPTENYDVPRMPLQVEPKIENAYYDTPRKIKDCLASEIIRKPCGCILRHVLPCGRLVPSQEIPASSKDTSNAPQLPPKPTHDYANLEPIGANYTNLTFCRSLELYENAASISKMAAAVTPQSRCCECSHSQEDYLEMTPLKGVPGYLPMSSTVVIGKETLEKGLSFSNPNLDGQSVSKPPPLPERQRQRSSSTENATGCRSPPPPPSCSIKIASCNCSVVRRSSSVPCKTAISNRDSSSSADSGVWEASVPRRSRSYDPLRELNFRFQKCEEKSTSAEAAVPVCPIVPGSSNGSAASDLSDYLETLSTSSHSSAGGPGVEGTTSNTPSCMLRPRSGGEYLSLQRLIGPVPEERHD